MPPAMAIGLSEVPFTPSLSRCPRFFEPWPVATEPCTPACSLPPAMAAPPPEPYFGRCSSLSLSVLIWSVQIRFIDNRSRGKIDKETLGVFVIAPAVLGRIEKTQILIYFITKIVRVIYGFAIQSHFHSISPVLDLI